MPKKKNRGKKKNEPVASGSDGGAAGSKQGMAHAPEPPPQQQGSQQDEQVKPQAKQQFQEAEAQQTSASAGASKRAPPVAPGQPGPSGDAKEVLAGAMTASSRGNVQALQGQLARMNVSSKTKGSFAKPFTSLEERKQHCGKAGSPIKLLANHFPMKLERQHVIHYDVELNIVQFKRPPRKSDLDLTMRAFVQMVKDHPKVFPKPHGVVFDGMKNAFSTEQLKFVNNAPSFDASVTVKEISDMEREVEVKISLQMVGRVSIGDAMQEFIRQQRTGVLERREDYHLGAIQALNIILGMAPRLKYDSIQRSHFPPKAEVIDLGQGKSLWVGTFKSVRVGWNLVLNVDMANKPGYEKKMVMQFIREFLGRPGFRGGPPQLVAENQLAEKLRDRRTSESVSKELKGLKVRFLRPGGPRQYRVNKLTDKGSKNLMLDVEGMAMSVFDYFVKEFKIRLRFPDLPCLHVGNPNRTIYWPLEMCEIQKQVAPKTKKLSEDQAAAMVRQTAKPPRQRKQLIINGLTDLMNNYKDDPYAREFGISVNDRMMDVTGRVLKAPSMQYSVDGKRGDPREMPVRDGKWTMNRCKFTQGQSLRFWGVLNLTRMPQGQVKRFVDDLYSEGNNCGLEIDYPVHLAGREDERLVEKMFTDLCRKVEQEKKQKPQLIMVIVSRKGPVRDMVKHVSDIVFGIPSQVMMMKTVEKANPQILHNVCLKLNSKLGGTNQVLASDSRPDVLKSPVMLMGADVTHSAPGEKKPSIAAVVASCDPSAALYNTEVSLQFGDQAIEEITNLQAMTYNLLMKFYQHNRTRKPGRIIFYRDGVSEGQFEIVLAKELTAIQRACTQLENGYRPGITFVIAQKRHNTRFFPQNEMDGIGRGKNIPPGTTVDSVVTHPTETSFYLASHEGIQVERVL